MQHAPSSVSQSVSFTQFKSINYESHRVFKCWFSSCTAGKTTGQVARRLSLFCLRSRLGSVRAILLCNRCCHKRLGCSCCSLACSKASLLFAVRAELDQFVEISALEFGFHVCCGTRSRASFTHVCVLTPAQRIVPLMHCTVDMHGRPARRFAQTQLVRKRRGRRFSGIRAIWPAHLIRRSSIVA